jgi:hypothetical protein
MNPMFVIIVVWALAAVLVARLTGLPTKTARGSGAFTSSDRLDKATRVLMALAIVGQAAISTFFVARVGGVSAIIAVVQIAVASAFWQLIQDSPGESRFQPLGVILPMLLLFGVIAALTLDIQSSFLPVVTWRGFLGK